MCAFDKFLKVNNLKKMQIAAFLGVTNAFITQLCSGKRKLPSDKLALIIANPHGWDVSVLTDESKNSSCDPQMEELLSVYQKMYGSEEKSLIGYLQRKVENQESLIRELYQQIGMLEAKLDLARKGESVASATGSSVVNAG